MYVDHFGFNGLAFQRASDPDHYFWNEGFETTLHALRDAIRCDRGLMLLTGESGVGKTAAVQLLELELRGETHFVSFDRRIFDIDEAEGDELRTESPTVVSVEDVVFHRLVEASSRRLDSSVPVLAVVDGAHMGSDVDLMGLLWAMARLRAGGNGTDRPGLLLVGDPELEQRFRTAPLRGLERDLQFKCRLDPLTPGQVDRYIRFHLEKAGYLGGALFSDSAVAYVEQYARGIPQLINNICGMALVMAAEDDVQQVSEEIVREAADDLLFSRHTTESVESIDSLSFDEGPIPATESDTSRDGIPGRVRDFDLWPDEPRSRLFVQETRDDDASSHALERSYCWLHCRVVGAWRNFVGTRQRLETRLQSARGAIERWLKTASPGVRVERRWGSFLIWIRQRSRHTWAALKRERRRLPRYGHALLAGLKRLRQKPLLDTGAGQPGNSTSASAWPLKQTLSQTFGLGAAVTFSSVMAVLAIAIWTLVLTHEWPTSPEVERSPRDAIAARTETSMSAPLTIEPFEHAPIATGPVVDGDNAGAYNVVALALPESSSDERAEGPPTESVLQGTAESKILQTAIALPPDREHATAIRHKDEESKPGTVEISMSPKAGITRRTTTAPFLSATNSESPITAEGAAGPAISSKARDEPHEAGRGKGKNRTTLDGPLPFNVYVVASGDTLWSISRHHNMTIDRLRSINNLIDKQVLRPSQSLYVELIGDQGQSSDAWHTVRPGENLSQIGRRYGISVAELETLNNLEDPSHLKIGQRLRLGAAVSANRQTSEKRADTQAASQG